MERPIAHLRIHRSRSRLRRQRWYWTLHTNGRKVAGSLEGYANRSEAEHMGLKVCGGGYTVYQ